MKKITIKCNHASGFPEWGDTAFSIFENRHGVTSKIAFADKGGGGGC